MKKLAITSAVIASLVAGNVLFAQSVTQGVTSTDTQTTHPVQTITEDEAKTIALGQVAGEVVKVKKDTDDGQNIYEIYIQTAEGKMSEVEIAATGELLEIEFNADDDGDRKYRKGDKHRRGHDRDDDDNDGGWWN